MNKEPKIEVIADSLSVSNNRITTVKLSYWLNDSVQDELITVHNATIHSNLSLPIKQAIAESIPTCLAENEWHLPFISKRVKETHPLAHCLQISVARCARVSKKLYDGATPSVADDLTLFTTLRTIAPTEDSYMGHQAVYLTSKQRWVFYSELFK